MLPGLVPPSEEAAHGGFNERATLREHRVGNRSARAASLEYGRLVGQADEVQRSRRRQATVGGDNAELCFQ